MKSIKPRQHDSSFLPEDYVNRRAERRTNIISVVLFVCVMFGVTAAFFVSNKKVSDVKKYQAAINTRYAQAAQQLEQLKELEAVDSALEQKAEVTTALYEKVPRSILMAELVNRMPPTATMLELELTSKRLDRPVRSSSKKRKDEPKAKSLSGKASRKSGRKGKDDEDEDQGPVITAPRFETSVEITGVAPVHEDVADYVANLQTCPLLANVELRSTESAKVEDRQLKKFLITADLRAGADARRIQPLESPRHPAAAPKPIPREDGWDVGGLMKMLNGGNKP